MIMTDYSPNVDISQKEWKFQNVIAYGCQRGGD
jgi:hypothetical protein